MIPKIISLYLPQFHEVKENSEWYGEGFTDWVAVRNAKPLFENHVQPRKPLDNNYYDLSDASVLKWQADLARSYGVDGFCFYHYWFDSETRLLEKPVELLLQHKEIDIEYCLSWVNESWKRTWSNVEKGNVWCDTFDKDKEKKDRNDRGLLVKQRYGREEEWLKHIEYLIPFFKDERYIRVEGKPVLCLYQPCEIACIKAMIDLWNSRLQKENIDGVYLIGASYGKTYSKNVDISYHHEPGTAFASCRASKEYIKSPEGTEFFEYDTLWKHLLAKVELGKIGCAFTDFDASPRKGNRGIIVKGSSPEKFAEHFTAFLRKNVQVGNKLVFVNAWNEWGEGMYLEPCEDYGYGYLQAVSTARQNVICDENSMPKEMIVPTEQTEKKSVAKSALQVNVFNQWLYACRKGICAAEFFEKYHYQTVAIYGMGILGKQLKEELVDSAIHVPYYIDMMAVPGQESFKRVTLEEDLPEVDCIVVTALAEFDQIYDVLKGKTEAAIVNISEIFEDLY